MKIELFYAIFYCQGLLESGVIMLLRFFELSTSMPAIVLLVSFLFNEHCSPIVVTGISLKYSFALSRIFKAGGV